MQTETTKNFLQKMFTGDSETILSWDSYKCHYCPEVSEVLTSLNVKNAILPGGTTRVIQTADVCWNSPFKAALRDDWVEWMRSGEKSFTKAGNMRSPSKTQLVEMILNAWNTITPEQIQRSFVVCGQTREVLPDEILCMRDGKSCNTGLQTLKDLLALPLEERCKAVGVEDIRDNFVNVEEEDENDPLMF